MFRTFFYKTSFLFRLRLTSKLLDYLYNVEKLQNHYLNTKKVIKRRKLSERIAHSEMKRIENPAKLKSKDYSPVIVTNSFKN